MRWNCPHCRSQLSAPDDEIASNWGFALCAHCMRFGLVRKSAQLAVKVDRAPAGEKFIRASLAGPKPVIRPAQRRRGTQTGFTLQRTVPTSSQRKTLETRLPEPLPEIPEKHRLFISRVLFLSCAGLMILGGFRSFSRNNAAPTSSDSISTDAMAPQHVDIGTQVEPRSLNVQIRNNPGHQSPVVGALDPNLRYSVLEIATEADGQWYRIDTGTDSPAWVSIQDVSPAGPQSSTTQ